jgi:hypothetical protein
VEGIDPYRAPAKKLGAAGFVARYTCFFLMKKPTSARPEETPDPFHTSIPYQTDLLRTSPSPVEFVDERGEFAWEWRVAQLKKRAGNPFPDRISVGRAPNCDVVLRFPYISKLHAHFTVDGKRVSISDQKSANGTKVNGREVKSGELVAVRVGDVVKFGALDLELADAARLFEVLAREASTSST